MSEQIIEVGEKDPDADKKNQNQVLDSRQKEIEAMYKPHAIEFTPIVFSLFIVMVIYWGQQAELENYITPESGLGYSLGITGGSMMLIMLLYSLRKRAKWMRGWGPTRYWFKIHMLLGILGPVLILFHCNFQLGSQNSNIALFSMLLVALSGVFGRYLYGMIHFGLYGSEMTRKQLEQDRLIVQDKLSRLIEISPRLYERINKYDKVLQLKTHGVIAGFFCVCKTSLQTRRSNILVRRMFVKACQQLADKEGWEKSKIEQTIDSGILYLNAHFMTIRKLVRLGFFERLFSLWHILHVPLFLMLIITATVHIFAIHMY